MAPSSLLTRALTYEAGGTTILSGITLAFSPGTITAILGPSGSGKTTLLKCLGTMVEPTGGDVTFRGKPLADIRPLYRANLAYVPQDDIIHRQLRVEQAFTYAARLRLDPGLPAKQIAERIDRITRQLGLHERKHYRIHKLSGGQRKRVNIGIELLAEPELLLLDEPASGLDPGTEQDLLAYLRRLAEQKTIVILTTHSMETLSMADRLVVLMAGSAVFAGTLPELLAYFQVVHVADLFKKLRTKGRFDWVRQFESSELAARASSPLVQEYP